MSLPAVESGHPPAYQHRMKTDRARLQRLLENEMAVIDNSDLQARVKALLIEPVFMRCAWDYGAPDETYPCWKVVGEPAVDTVGIIYCEQGFGPTCPWGLIWMNEAVPSMGKDSGWFRSFREAAADLLDLPPSSLNVP